MLETIKELKQYGLSNFLGRNKRHHGNPHVNGLQRLRSSRVHSSKVGKDYRPRQARGCPGGVANFPYHWRTRRGRNGRAVQKADGQGKPAGRYRRKYREETREAHEETPGETGGKLSYVSRISIYLLYRTDTVIDILGNKRSVILCTQY